jgi:hypothetical protein
MKLEHGERKKQVKPDNRIKLHLFYWRVILNVVSGAKPGSVLRFQLF